MQYRCKFPRIWYFAYERCRRARRLAVRFLSDLSMSPADGFPWTHRWLFLIEGLITFAIGSATFFMMPPSPTQTKSWFRPNGWFTDREEVIATTRILRDDPTKGDMHNREGLTLKRMWLALKDYDMWPLYIMYVAPAPSSTWEFDFDLIHHLQWFNIRYPSSTAHSISHSLITSTRLWDL